MPDGTAGSTGLAAVPVAAAVPAATASSASPATRRTMSPRVRGAADARSPHHGQDESSRDGRPQAGHGTRRSNDCGADRMPRNLPEAAPRGKRGRTSEPFCKTSAALSRGAVGPMRASLAERLAARRARTGDYSWKVQVPSSPRIRTPLRPVASETKLQLPSASRTSLPLPRAASLYSKEFGPVWTQVQ